jgi:transcriptional regulator with XRE-family HTH domain
VSQPTTLGELIRERRLAHGMSLSQFATRVDHSPAEVRTWERGEAEPALDSRDALVDVLEVDPEVLDAVWPLPPPDEPEVPLESESAVPGPAISDDFDDTFLAVGGVVAGVAVADTEQETTTSETDEVVGAAVLTEEPTEAIGAPFVVAAPVPTDTAMVTLVEPEAPRRWNPVREIYDPNKPWLTYIRTTLTVVVLALLAVVLIRLLGQLFDALSELLDTVQTTDDVQSTVEAMAAVILN